MTVPTPWRFHAHGTLQSSDSPLGDVQGGTVPESQPRPRRRHHTSARRRALPPPPVRRENARTARAGGGASGRARGSGPDRTPSAIASVFGSVHWHAVDAGGTSDSTACGQPVHRRRDTVAGAHTFAALVASDATRDTCRACALALGIPDASARGDTLRAAAPRHLRGRVASVGLLTVLLALTLGRLLAHLVA